MRTRYILPAVLAVLFAVAYVSDPVDTPEPEVKHVKRYAEGEKLSLEENALASLSNVSSMISTRFISIFLKMLFPLNSCVHRSFFS